MSTLAKDDPWRALRRSSLTALMTWLVGTPLVAIVASEIQGPWSFVVVGLYVVVFFAVNVWYSHLRCPNCGGRFYQHKAKFTFMPPWFRPCAECGAAVGDPVTRPPAPAREQV